MSKAKKVTKRTASKKAVNLIKQFEGCRLTAYQDSVGVWTIGYGTTNADKSITGLTIKKGTKITQAQAEHFLLKSLNSKYAAKVNKFFKKYKWSQNQFDALISFAYNIGSIDQLTANKIGYDIGLIDNERYKKLLDKEKMIDAEVERMKKTTVGARAEVQELLARYESTALQSGTTLAELLKRPELSYEIIGKIDKDRQELPEDVKEQVNIELKYEGYIKRQLRQVEQYKKLENKKIPDDIDYDDVYSLRKEAVQKLKELRPASVGQASRISGVSPADISVLLIYLGK